MNFCVVDNDFGFFVPADSGVYQIATACQAGCVPVNEFEMGIIMTQLYFVTILKSCLPNSAQAAIIDNKFNCIHAYAKETFCDVVFELYESLVAVYKKD